MLVAGNQRWLIPLVLGLSVTAILRGALAWMQQIQLARLESKLALTQMTRFFWHVMRLPMVFYTQRHPGDINNRVMANDRLARLLSGDLAVNAVGLVRIVFFSAIMVAYDATLAAICIVLSLLNLAALIYAAQMREDMSRRLARQQGLLGATAMGGIALIETLKAERRRTDYSRRLVASSPLHQHQAIAFDYIVVVASVTYRADRLDQSGHTSAWGVCGLCIAP